MSKSVQATLGPMELQTVKRDLRSSSEPLQKVSSDAGKLVDRAISASGMTRDTAARNMGISASLLTRQIQNTDNQHVSFQRLMSPDMPDRFKRELILAMAEEVDGVSVRTLVVLERSA